MKYMLHGSDKFVTFHNRLSKIPPLFSVHFTARRRKSRVFCLSWSSLFFTLSAAYQMRKTHLVYPQSFKKV